MGYSATGDYTSRVYDVGHAGIFHLFSWIATIPAETTLHLQIRSGASSDLSAATWYGPDGTAATYFTIQDGEALPSVSQGDQYIQYRAYFTTDGTVTPAL